MKMNQCCQIEKDDKIFYIPKQYTQIALKEGFSVEFPNEDYFYPCYDMIKNLEFLIDNPRFCGEQETTVTLKQYRLLLKLLDENTIHNMKYDVKQSNYDVPIFVTKEEARYYISRLITIKNSMGKVYTKGSNDFYYSPEDEEMAGLYWENDFH